VPIEERDAGEITHIQGLNAQGQLDTVRLTPASSRAINHAFDVTPARLVTGLITEKGIFPATEAGLSALAEVIKDQV
jgi:methylthioribose-1-phosphate isomerase